MCITFFYGALPFNFPSFLKIRHFLLGIGICKPLESIKYE